MLRYLGYKVDRSAISGGKAGQVTIESPGGKLVHTFHWGGDFHNAGIAAMRWIRELGEAREPDPDAERNKTTIEFMAKIKRENKPGDRGVSECPFCKADVHWLLQPSNGHIWARCSTKDCFGVIE